jgi:hypothetical protein
MVLMDIPDYTAVIEPKLDESQAQYPVEKERNLHVPAFILIRVKKS